MIGTFRLAWRYVTYHRFKSLLMIACIFLASVLPLAVRMLLAQFEQQIVARADATPLVIGARGSRLDLALGSLYFESPPADTIPAAHARTIREKGWGYGIPLHLRHTATGKAQRRSARPFPIVGTTLDYFEFRNLQVAEGEMLAVLGDCLLGADVARRLQLGPGDRLASDAENILDISGSYPLNMLVRGILKPTASPDDEAVFVDLKTAWVIDDLGHGHQDAETLGEDRRLATEGNRITTNAAISTFTEINEDNLASFHFHGDSDTFPVTALIGVPRSTKDETLMLAWFSTDVEETQIAIPRDVVSELMAMVFQVERFFWFGAILIASSTALLLVLVVFLSLRLRQREMQTMFKLGCSRGTIAMMQAWELFLVFAVAACLVAVAVWLVGRFGQQWIQQLLIGGY